MMIETTRLKIYTASKEMKFGSSKTRMLKSWLISRQQYIKIYNIGKKEDFSDNKKGYSR